MTDARFLFSLISGVSIGGVAAYLGSLMLTRRMALVAGPLGHLTLPGVALAMIWGFDLSLGAFPFVLVGAVVIWWLERRTKLPTEALTAVVFASGVAIAFLFLPIDQAEAALVGDITQAGAADTVLSVVACVATAVAAHRAYPKWVLSSISEDLAACEGVNVKRYELLYLLLIAVIVALGVRMVGGLMTAALVAIPAAAARNVATHLKQFALLSTGSGIVSSILGITLCRWTGLPAGPLIVIVSSAIFGLTVLLARVANHKFAT